VAWVSATTIALAIIGVIAFFGVGAGDPIIQRFVVHRLESLTGARVELKSISIQWLSLRAGLRGLVIHGSEPEGTEPLFTAENIEAGLRIDSFWGRKVSLYDLLIQEPHVHVRAERNGATNFPRPNRSSGKPIRETLFNLHSRHLKIENGWVLYNDVRSPLAAEGSGFNLALDAGGPLEHPLYLGTLDWKSLQIAAKHFFPFPSSIFAKFTLWANGVTIEQAVISAGNPSIRVDAQAELQDFSNPKWTFKYRGSANLQTIRDTLRAPGTPTGLASFHGEGTFSGGQIRTDGSYAGQDIVLSYQPIFHASGVSSRGNYRLDNKGIEVRDFLAEAFQGRVTGHVSIRWDHLLFRADTHIEGVHLAGVLPAIEHKGFPVDELHWDALLSGDTVETWTGAFHDFIVGGNVHLGFPEAAAAGHFPVEGDWQFRYRDEPHILDLSYGQFETVSSRGTVSGTLGPRSTQMDFTFETTALENYRDFINAIRDAAPDSPDAIKTISGSAQWDGKISAAAGTTTFSGHLRGNKVTYETFAIDSLEGDVIYSPDEIVFAHGRAKKGSTQVGIDLALALSDWSFLPENTWSAEVNLDSTPLDALEHLAGWSYPVTGKLTGQFHGRGTRESPTLTGLFDLADGSVYGLSFNRLRGQLTANHEEVRIANAELRLFPLQTEAGRSPGVLTGSAGYNFADGNISAELVGATLPLSNFGALRNSRFPLDGQISFHLKANGPLTAPQAEGTVRVVDLRIGNAVIGSFDGALTSDGRNAQLKLSSAMTTGQISGGYTLGLAAPYPFEGRVDLRNIDLDPFLLSELHLGFLNTSGKVDGEIATTGSLQHMDTFVVDAKLSRLLFTYANVQLENTGPVHFHSSRETLQIDPATFHGPDTNVKIGGAVSFSGQKALNMQLNGTLDLRLLASFVPGLTVGGSIQANATFGGTLDHPSITGRLHVENASAREADFPTGLSNIKGDLVFDATRLYFSNLTAEAGGGTLHLTGGINYTERPVRYDITARSDTTRIRYPEGMSWLAAGSLRLTGTTNSAVLSGRVTVERVVLTQGLEVAGVFVSGKGGISGPSTTSSFLRNLQFDIEAVSAPDARMEWPGAQLEAEANLRVRGTWETPIILGHIHVLAGNLLFHGNRYEVARGDLNFANPFRIDPDVNVEATTTIQQYQLTLNFNGLASKLTLAYRSDPPLPANDIVTLLAIGQTSSEGTVRSSGTNQPNAGVTTLLSEAVSQKFSGPLEKLFGITNFRVDPGLTSVGSTGTETNAARVTVQQRVTRNLTVTYVSNVGSDQEQVIQVEYNVTRSVSIVALRDYNGTFGIDIKITKRFQ
jgi:translocation and assembly module TamB